jgi:hypothetical protein
MANEQNLRPVRNKKEARELGKKGGIASGIARREKSSMKKLLKSMLEENATKDGKTYMELATLGLIKGAVKGDSKNYKVILETLGEYNNSDEDKKDGIILELVEALRDVKSK